MTDTTDPRNLPLPPDLFTIPTALIEQWSVIPASERLTVPLTRQDIDHLLLGLLRTLEAQSLLDNAVVEWSNGKINEANLQIAEFRRRNVEAQNSIRQLAAAIISSALKERQHG